MVKELETLKDNEQNIVEQELRGRDIIDRLRDDAREWIDALEKEGNSDDVFHSGSDTWQRGKLTITAEKWIEHFFNLEDEKLTKEEAINITSTGGDPHTVTITKIVVKKVKEEE